MADTSAARIVALDAAITLERRRRDSAEACGDEWDAGLYEAVVDELLDQRYRLMHGPL